MGDVDDIPVLDAPAPTIVSVELVEDGVIVEFTDGDKAMFCSQSLHEMLLLSRLNESPGESGLVQ